MEKIKAPAVKKAFAIIEEIAKEEDGLTFSEIYKRLDINKSTLYNILETLLILNVVEKVGNVYKLGIKFYIFKTKKNFGDVLIKIVHPFLEKYVNKTNLSIFFGSIEDEKAIILDKVEPISEIKISSEIGMKLPLLAGSHGKALASLLDKNELINLLNKKGLRKFTKNSITDKELYLKEIEKVKNNKIAYDNEEYILGIKSLAVPLKFSFTNKPYAIWTYGIAHLFNKKSNLEKYVKLLKEISFQIQQEVSK